MAPVFVCSLLVLCCPLFTLAQDSLRIRKVGDWPYATAYSVGYDPRTRVAFVGNGQVILSIDVSNPANPVKIGEVHLSGGNNRLWLHGNYVYMAAGKLDIIDISNPRSLTIKSSLKTSRPPFSVFASGNYAYLAGEESGLRVIDVSDPSRPIEVGSYQTAGRAMYVAASGNRVYVSDFGAGLRILDVSNPSEPQELGFFPEADIWGVTLYGNYAIIQKFNGSDIRVIDVSDPTLPIEASSIDWPAPGNGVSLMTSGSYVYVCAEWMDGIGVRIVDISAPANPTAVGSIGNVLSGSVAVSDGFAYISDWANGFHVYDVSTPSTPRLVSNYDLPGVMNDVTVAGDVAYIATEAYVHPGPGSAEYMHVELRLIDVSIPSTPVEMGFSVGGIATGRGVAASGRYAYIASDGNGLRVFDNANPNTPTEVGFVLTPGNSVRVVLSPSYAFLAAGDSGIRIIDVSDPVSPSETGYYDSPGFTSDVAVSPSLAFLADGSYGVRIVDIATPSAPHEVGHYVTSQPAVSVAVSGNDLFAGASNGDLYRIDVSNPSAPTLKSTLSYSGSGIIRRIAISGNYAYLAGGLNGVRVVDIGNATSMSERGYYVPYADISGLALSGKYIYAITPDAGLYVLEFPAVTLGDANGDGTISVLDVFYLINALFLSGPAPIGSCDVNADLNVDAADILFLVNHLFAGGQAPQ